MLTRAFLSSSTNRPTPYLRISHKICNNFNRVLYVTGYVFPSENLNFRDNGNTQASGTNFAAYPISQDEFPCSSQFTSHQKQQNYTSLCKIRRTVCACRHLFGPCCYLGKLAANLRWTSQVLQKEIESKFQSPEY
jgi:hypothetical protein